MGGKPDKIALFLVVLWFASEYYHSLRFLRACHSPFTQHKENVPHSRQSNNILHLKSSLLNRLPLEIVWLWCSTPLKGVILVSCICVGNTTENFQNAQVLVCRSHRVPTPSPLPLYVTMVDRNHLNEEITPLLPTGIGEWYSQTISKFRSCSALAPLWTPYKQKCWNNSGGRPSTVVNS